MGGTGGGHASKDHGQESNPVAFDQDRAIMVRALPGEPPGRPDLININQAPFYSNDGSKRQQST